MPETMYTTGEAAKLLGVHTTTMYRWCVNGQITAHKTSPIGNWRITRKALVEYAEENNIPLQEPERNA
ncbi:MAG: helix-turn-helix domain-containing protein [Caldilineaceae bacterium]